jgi:hypothetical protein
LREKAEKKVNEIGRREIEEGGGGRDRNSK